MKSKVIFLLVCVATTFNSYAQETSSHTVKFEEGMVSPEATLKNVSWISGYWRGEAFGGVAEEIWSDPLGNSMMFSFKLVVDEKVVFYELGGISQTENTLLLQLKHFHGDFKGWEEKEETVNFRLVKIEKNKIFFDQLTFEKISDNEMNVYVVIDDKQEGEKEALFNYKKYK